MTNQIDSKKQKARLALILKTGRLRLWFYYPATRHYRYLSEAGEFGPEFNPSEFGQAFHPTDLEVLRSLVFDICDGKQDSGKVKLRSRAEKESECKHYEESITVISRDENGLPTALMGIQHDVTDEYRQQEKIKKLLIRYQTIFNSSLLDNLYYDSKGVLREINERACENFNLKSREQVLDGSFLLKNNPFFNQLQFDQIEDSYTGSIVDFDKLTEERYRNEEIGLTGKMYYESAINPIRNEEGKLEGVYMSGRDITEMVNSFHRLQKSVEKLQKGTDSIRQYIANIDYALSVSGVQLVNYYPHSYTFELINRETNSKLHMSQLRCIRLATMPFRRTVNSVLNRMDHLTRHDIKQAIEIEIRDKKGRQIWLAFNMVPMFDAEGRVERYFGTYRDITDMVETEKQLAIETKKAQETELLKQTFLTNMSYEIRTPLNNIVGYAGLFTGEHDPSDEPFFMEQIKRSTGELLLLVNDILYISRLETNMEEYTKEPTDFAGAFEALCLAGLSAIKPEVQPIIVQTYNRLVVDIDMKHVTELIQRMCSMSCLLTSQGSIQVSYEYHRGELTFRFEDTGKGVTEEMMSHIFDHFTRDEKGELIGSGLDLAIAQLLAHQMGGTIDIQSDYGKGTSAWMSIPCTALVIDKKRNLEH